MTQNQSDLPDFFVPNVFFLFGHPSGSQDNARLRPFDRTPKMEKTIGKQILCINVEKEKKSTYLLYK